MSTSRLSNWIRQQVGLPLVDEMIRSVSNYTKLRCNSLNEEIATWRLSTKMLERRVTDLEKRINDLEKKVRDANYFGGK